MKKYGPWTITKSEPIYADPWISVKRDLVIRPDGKPGTYSTICLKSGVCVIAIGNDEVVHFTKEFHYAVGRVTIEGVSGGIEEGESAELTATRELQEELGLRSSKLTHLGQIDPFTGSIYSTVDLFLATELEECERNLEGTELIERVSFPFAEAIELVRRGEITHAPSCVALLRIALDGLHR